MSTSRKWVCPRGGGIGQESRGNEEDAKKYALEVLSDYLFTFQEFSTDKMRAKLSGVGLSLGDYLHLQSPAVEWLTKAAGQGGCSTATFTAILGKYNASCKSAMVLKHILRSFDAAHYCVKGSAMVALVRQDEVQQRF